MQNYSIMSMDLDYIEEICENVKDQIDTGVCTMVLFEITLIPEGTPFIDKAANACEKFDVFRDRLKEMGIDCGILVQSTIGHNYPLDARPDIQMYQALNSGQITNMACPTDDKFRKYLFDQLVTIAKHKPAHIMFDDDMRLMQRPQQGCACPNHLKLLAEEYGEEVTREDLYDRLCNPKSDDDKRLLDCFVKTQQGSVAEIARIMRSAIDSVDPSIPGSYCGVGTNFDSGVEVARILSGEGHPVTARINNGNYTAKGARGLSTVMFKAASQIEKIKDVATDILAETDTCPQMRYSTSASTLHTHFTASILEGCTGAKHWISRIVNYEPECGIEYRKKLSHFRGFYEYLASVTKELKWIGARIPVSKKVYFDYTNWETIENHPNSWAECVLERMGIPMYYSSKIENCAFFEGGTDNLFSDEEILEMLSGQLVLSCEAAYNLIKRGFGEYLGVDVRKWNGIQTTCEFLGKKKMGVQNNVRELVPLSDDVIEESTVCHLHNGKEYERLFPGVTTFRNKLGGLVHVFSGVPKGTFDHCFGFAMLNPNKKRQFLKILEQGDCLPVYYPYDSEILLKAAITPEEELMVAYFNISLDNDEKMYLKINREFTKILYLTNDGKKAECKYHTEDGVVVIDRPSSVLHPEILFIK